MALAIIPQICLEKNYIKQITKKEVKNWSFDSGCKDDLCKRKRRPGCLDQHSPVCFAAQHLLTT